MSELTATEHDGRADFDFYIGTWSVHNRRLRERLKGSDSWEEFEGISVARKVLGGLGNVDEITMHRASGRQEGMTVRLFDPDTRQWYLYWASGVTGAPLDVPLIGEFKDGRGEFYAQETFEGKRIFNRYIWSSVTATSCRWEQAFSPDGGATWETNWIMDFVRSE